MEQADAALVVPNGKTLLIDSGKNGHGSRIKAVMDLAGVTQIDAFVNSHYQEDHFGGIDDLVNMGVLRPRNLRPGQEGVRRRGGQGKANF